MEFDLFYNVLDCGDGSVAVIFHKDEISANQAENEDLGWGESSVNSVKLTFKDGKLYYRSYDKVTDGVGKIKYEYVWHEISQSK